jgi:hypothetical protein
MRSPFPSAFALAGLAAVAALGGCGEPDVPRPSMVAVPKMAREVLHVPAGGYPLDTCVACGNRLGENGNPCIFQHEGVEVRLCCVDCREEFLADPAAGLAKIREARSPK